MKLPLTPLASFSAPLALAALLSGCASAGGGPSQPAVVFPSRAEIAALPSAKPLPDAFPTGAVPEQTWTVESAPADAAAPYDDTTLTGPLLRDLVQPYAATTTLSPALRCTALEIARFQLRHGHASPTDSLRRFMVARCGGDAPDVRPIMVTFTAPKGVKDAEIAAHARESFANLLAKALGDGSRTRAHGIGMGMVRDGAEVAMVAVVAGDQVHMEAGSRTVDATRHVTLRGTARGDFDAITGLVNRGDSGVARCLDDPRVRAPKFEMTCELAEGDRWAWVEITGRARGRLLEESLAEVIVHEGDGAEVTYRARSLGAPAPVHGPEDFTAQLVDRLNGVRSAASLPPLSLAARQSAENARLAGTLFDGQIAHDGAATDRAALGLLAGWDVEGGIIRSGYFYLGAAAPTRDATEWLASAVEHPLGRMALLDPALRQIAIGPAIPEGAPALGAAVTTYALFESDDHKAEELQFLRNLTAARTNRGLAAPVRVGGFSEMADEARRVTQGKPSMDALRDLIAAAARRTGGAVRGWVLETNDPAHVEIPEAFLAEGAMRMFLGVTHHRAPGAAWGQYVVFVVSVGQAPAAQTAAAGALGRAM